MRLLKVATCSLNQWAMDFDCNLKNIKESIRKSKEAAATIRLGPELEVTGYGCEDHFLELDTVIHSWECLTEILVGFYTDGILCSIGMPILRNSELYNSQLLCYNRKILMIRPNIWLANDASYSELRWFSAWKQIDGIEEFLLPPDVADAISQISVPFGYGYIQFSDGTTVAAETCEELFTAEPPHGELALTGVQVFLNTSGSHHQLRKLKDRLDAIKGATRTRGGVYMYKDVTVVVFITMVVFCVVVNGDVVTQGSQFSHKDVELLRVSIGSFKHQANNCATKAPLITIKYHTPEEEIKYHTAFGPACWTWDYLTWSSGFLLPLSGRADSSCSCHCRVYVSACCRGNCIRIGHYTDGQYPTQCKEFAKRIFYMEFMGNENSSDATRSRAKLLADEIGSWHLDVSIDSVISSLLSFFQTFTGKRPVYKVDKGSDAENLWLQNIQARIRMVLAYMLSSLLSWAHSKPGFYLVLGSSNVDEALRGYFTKYDCSSADINPIGGISKQDLRIFLKWAAVNHGFSSLAEIEAAPPTVELEPIRSIYKELSIYGRLQKIFRFGPVSMFQDLCQKWGEELSLLEIANKVKYFFKYYSINRHKMNVLTPSYHAESYSPEDNMFDHRLFLCNPNLPHQFRKIDELVNQFDGNNSIVGASAEHGQMGVTLKLASQLIQKPAATLRWREERLSGRMIKMYITGKIESSLGNPFEMFIGMK
ncbi:hypothetical protein MKX01_041559 [Papaver californicum]|nr:hypothetical protein MKX01_041559 [Papaver californicum]